MNDNQNERERERERERSGTSLDARKRVKLNPIQFDLTSETILTQFLCMNNFKTNFKVYVCRRNCFVDYFKTSLVSGLNSVGWLG
jgi:hypothetical protein